MWSLRLLVLPWALVACVSDPKENDSDPVNPDLDGDGWEMDLDCDDEDPARHPEAVEACDGVDNDCDGDTDEDPANTWFADADHDGYGDPATSQSSCGQPPNYVADSTDCDDRDSTVSPGHVERCNGIDDDCDGVVDEEASDTLTWYTDADADGHGDPNSPIMSCEPPEGAVNAGDDCDDADPDVSPSAFELCDGIDQDCDGTLDEDARDTTRWYSDGDGDGHGDPAAYRDTCEPPAGFVAPGDDCDDTREDVAPGEIERCDGRDNDCDGTTDGADAIDTTAWYADADGDRYGDASTIQLACTQPAGFVADTADCDDTDVGVNPAAAERCDGLDNDCDRIVDEGCPPPDTGGDTGSDTGDTDSGDTASGSSVCDGANTGATFDDLVSMGGPGLLLGILHIPTVDEDVVRVDVFTGEQVGTNTVAIWSDDPVTSFPDTMLAEGSFVMSSVNGWQGAELSSCVTLTAGTRYWVVWAPINGAQSSWDTAGTAVTYSGSFDGGASWSGPYSNTVKYQLSCCE